MLKHFIKTALILFSLMFYSFSFANSLQSQVDIARKKADEFEVKVKALEEVFYAEQKEYQKLVKEECDYVEEYRAYFCPHKAVLKKDTLVKKLQDLIREIRQTREQLEEAQLEYMRQLDLASNKDSIELEEVTLTFDEAEKTGDKLIGVQTEAENLSKKQESAKSKRVKEQRRGLFSRLFGNKKNNDLKPKSKAPKAAN